MSIETDNLTAQTAQEQMTASVTWGAYLGFSMPIDVENIPDEVEMALRNPAVYKDRLDTGEVTLPEKMTNRWNSLNDEALLICDIAQRGRSSDYSDNTNSIGNLQHLAFTKQLPASTAFDLSIFLGDSAELFGESISIDYGNDSLLKYFSVNARTALKGVSEAKSRLEYAKRAETRIRNRHV